jgi:CheY-like chemotaxis protein
MKSLVTWFEIYSSRRVFNVEAADGQEGVKKANEVLPDLIVLDLVMPELSGVEVLRSLKGNPRTSKIPVVLHTSKKLDVSERNLLQDAIAIIPKENESREALVEHFEAALTKAGIAHPPLLQKKQHAHASSQVGQEI